MRRKALVTLVITSFSGLLFAAQRQGTAGGQIPASPPRQAARPAGTPTLTIQVTDTAGLPLANVQVTAQGPVSRDGATAEDGSVRFANMRPGGYRLRFVRDGSITLDRDITIRAGEPMLVDVTLSPAPPQPKLVEPARPAAPPPAARPLGAPVDPKVTPIPSFLDKNLITGRDAQKSSSLGCTSTATGTLYQLREAWVNRSHDNGDEWIYVVAGEATLRLGGSEQHLQAGTFTLIPHTVAYSMMPTGKNPFIVVSVLSGPACTQ